jgi:hypothetical protein
MSNLRFECVASAVTAVAVVRSRSYLDVTSWDGMCHPDDTEGFRAFYG